MLIREGKILVELGLSKRRRRAICLSGQLEAKNKNGMSADSPLSARSNSSFIREVAHGPPLHNFDIFCDICQCVNRISDGRPKLLEAIE